MYKLFTMFMVSVFSLTAFAGVEFLGVVQGTYATDVEDLCGIEDIPGSIKDEIRITADNLPEGLRIEPAYDEWDEEWDIDIYGVVTAVPGTYDVTFYKNGKKFKTSKIKVYAMPKITGKYTASSSTLTIGRDLYDWYGDELEEEVEKTEKAKVNVTIEMKDGKLTKCDYTTESKFWKDSLTLDDPRQPDDFEVWAYAKVDGKEGVVCSLWLDGYPNDGSPYTYFENYVTLFFANSGEVTCFTGYYKARYDGGYSYYIREKNDYPEWGVPLKMTRVVELYTQTFDANGGSGGTTKKLNYNATLTAPKVTRTGYTFTGWAPTVPSKVPAKNVTYKAQWKINQYTQKFDANGGTGGKTVKQNYNSALTAPTVTREGYVFTGWSPTVPTKVPAKNVTYKAQWKANSDYLKTSVAKNQVTITGCSRTLIGPLTIPAKIGGKPVVAIAKNALKGQTKLTKVVIPSGVTSVGENAFANCTKITTLSLPATLKTVGKNAFSKVAPTTLTAAKLPGGGMTTSKITKVTIAADATSVEYKAFYGLKSMTSLTIHSKVKAIYGRAFENCTGLTSLTLPKGVTTLGGNAFTGCTKITTLSLPATLKSVSGNAFSKVAPKTLTAAALPGGGMTTSKITKVTIAADATSVAYKAFYGLKSMTSLTIHSKVKAIYGRAFENCTGLTSLTLPKGVTSLGGNTFAGCTKITTLSLPATLKSVSGNAFSKVAPKTLTAAQLPGGGMTTSKITKVTIAADATSVAYKAFYGLKSMTSLTIHSKVKAIYGRAFEKCTGLKTVTIPASVTSISGYAFSGCTGLTSVTFKGNPPSAQATSFPAKIGYYPAANATKWKKVIDKKGKWCNLTMRQTGTVASAPKFEEDVVNVSMMAEVDAEMVNVMPAWICGTFEGAVLTVTADAEITESVVLTLTAEGSLFGEWTTADGMACCLMGVAEIVAVTDTAITLTVTSGWTNAPTTLTLKWTETGVTMDYNATDAATYTVGVLTLAP